MTTGKPTDLSAWGPAMGASDIYAESSVVQTILSKSGSLEGLRYDN